MKISTIPFGLLDWCHANRPETKGKTAVAYCRTHHFGNVRFGMAETRRGYLADHWCTKGHILLCLEGELRTELKDGREFTLKPGMSYQVADDAEPHRSATSIGAKLFVVD